MVYGLPKDIKVPDCFSNGEGAVVISAKLKAFVEQQNIPMIEFLPVTIYNHKDSALEEKYYILNSLSVIDCIDTAKSTIFWNAIDPDMISGAFGLVLVEDNLKVAPVLFRLKHALDATVVNEELKTALMQSGCTGMRFVDVKVCEL